MIVTYIMQLRKNIDLEPIVSKYATFILYHFSRRCKSTEVWGFFKDKYGVKKLINLLHTLYFTYIINIQ